MNVDEILNQLVSEETCQPNGTTGGGTPAAINTACSSVKDTAEKRARLEALVAGGLSERFLGRAMSLEQATKLSDSEVVSLHTRYEVVLGSATSKILGRSILSMYSDINAYLKPGLKPNSLTDDLETNLIIEHDLTLCAGGLYRSFGRLLAPLSALFITVKHWRAADDVSVSDGAGGDCPAVENEKSQ
jgi:hypothetical protein